MKKESRMSRPDYTLRDGKDAAMANRRQAMAKAQAMEADAFVKREQNALKSKGGKAPMLRGESMEFNAYMCNDGEHAQEFGRELTRGLDKDAFPVR